MLKAFSVEFTLARLDRRNLLPRYNIVFLGVFGACKNQLINYLFNQNILHPTTENQSFYICGKYNGRGITVGAMIDLCGPSIEADQLEYLISDSLESNLHREKSRMISKIDAVVIVTAGRLERGHKTSITRFLDWLELKNNPSKFVFIHNEKSPGVSEEFKRKNLDYVLAELGVTSSLSSQPRSLSVSTLQPNCLYHQVKYELDLLRRTVLDRPKAPGNQDVPQLSDRASSLTVTE